MIRFFNHSVSQFEKRKAEKMRVESMWAVLKSNFTARIITLAKNTYKDILTSVALD